MPPAYFMSLKNRLWGTIILP